VLLEMKKAALSSFLLSAIWLFACHEDDSLTCETHAGMYGTLYNETALSDFAVCGEFKLAETPDIIAHVNGENRTIGQNYVFEELNGEIQSVYYIKGSLKIWRKDSLDYHDSAFDFTNTVSRVPQDFLFENEEVYIELIFSKETGNPSHQGPTQYIDWQDFDFSFSKTAQSDAISGYFQSKRGEFWIPGPASNSYAGLDLRFELF
jgi:hypothetical protein